MLVGSKETGPFMQQPIIKDWLSSVQTERTKEWYAYNLMRFLKGIGRTAEGFLADIEKNPKEASRITKTFLGNLESKSTARVLLSAVKSFTAYYEAQLPLNGLKIRVARTRRKPYLAWTDAQKIIMECKEPYRSIFRFMLCGGLGEDEFMGIQRSQEIHASIEKQRDDKTKAYMRIDLKPRKNNTDTFYALVPREFVPKFPLRNYEYRVKEGPRKGEVLRGGELIDNQDMQCIWQRASARAGLRQKGLGPHTLRSAFRSQCAKIGVADAVAEFAMGHGSRDQYGYSREMEDEEYVAGELLKLWKGSRSVTASELDKRDQEIANLKERLARTELTRDERDERIVRLEADFEKRSKELAKLQYRVETMILSGELMPNPEYEAQHTPISKSVESKDDRADTSGKPK